MCLHTISGYESAYVFANIVCEHASLSAVCVSVINCHQSHNRVSLETDCLLLEQRNYAVHHYPFILPLSSSITPSLSCYYRTHLPVPCWHLLLFPSLVVSSPLELFLIVFLSSVLFVFCRFLSFLLFL